MKLKEKVLKKLKKLFIEREKNMFKVGEKVRVRKNLKVSEYYGGIIMTPGMSAWRNEIFTISRRIEEDKYFLDGTGSYTWSAAMLSKVRKRENKENKEDIIVEVIKGDNRGLRAINHGGCLEFFQFVNGHDGSGIGVDGYCWYLSEDEYKNVKLEKVKVHDVSKVKEMTNNYKDYFENLKIITLYNKCKDSISNFQEFIELLKEDNECELIYRINDEEDKLILRKNNKYFMCLESALEFPTVEDNLKNNFIVWNFQNVDYRKVSVSEIIKELKEKYGIKIGE